MNTSHPAMPEPTLVRSTRPGHAWRASRIAPLLPQTQNCVQKAAQRNRLAIYSSTLPWSIPRQASYCRENQCVPLAILPLAVAGSTTQQATTHEVSAPQTSLPWPGPAPQSTDLPSNSPNATSNGRRRQTTRFLCNAGALQCYTAKHSSRVRSRPNCPELRSPLVFVPAIDPHRRSSIDDTWPSAVSDKKREPAQPSLAGLVWPGNG